MKKYGLNELREMFLSYFEGKGHLRLPSFSLIPQNDASLLLINSGMAPMKPWFTGDREPPCRRVCTCQKCIRTGDIDNIGHTDRHGTYFEMLGNFSFGDYFKKEAIAYCWEFLTEVVGLPADRLYPSVYLDDDEAVEIWNNDIGISPERISRFGKADNFWEHGAGPCGPCSEVYFDRGAAYGCGKPDCAVGCDCDRYIEVWNNVFSQFYNDGNNNYTDLTQKNIDTGMGLERLAVVCQDVGSLFDVDTVLSITNRVGEITGAKYGRDEKTDVSLRVITDHIRSATMMICDGVLPSNEGRGYVLRRLLRRAARHGKLLGMGDPFLYRVCETVIDENKGAYPELLEKQDYITRVIRIEEENFAKTIDGGMKILADLLGEYKRKNESVFSGADTFKLYDTFGFPVDLTMELLEEAGMTVDRAGFDALMKEQKERARTARAAMGDLAWSGADLGLDSIPTEFTGYEKITDEATILAIAVDDELRASLRKGESGIIVLDKTPFYAEMGGQVADHGTIFLGESVFSVTDVQKNSGGKHLHYGHMEKGVLNVDSIVTASLDIDRRNAIRRAHSCTHLLHRALREVLGEHVEQAGSLVMPDAFRFDFTHFSALSPEELQRVDGIVNDVILDGLDICTIVTNQDEAKKMGAMALFGEKYGDIVRVIRMGDFSTELCGGTHLDNTAKIGNYHTSAEFSVASGVRRIEAIVGKRILESLTENINIIARVSDTLKTNSDGLEKKIEQLLADQKEVRRQIDKLRAQNLNGIAEDLLSGAKNVKGLAVITSSLENIPTEQLRILGDFIRDRDEHAVAVLASADSDKITFLAVCGKTAVSRGVKAGDLIKEVTKITGGSGGGKPDSAMGGGKDILMLDNALAVVDEFVNNHAN